MPSETKTSMRRTRRRQGRQISSSQLQFQQVHISLIRINTNYHFCNFVFYLSFHFHFHFFIPSFQTLTFFSAKPPQLLRTSFHLQRSRRRTGIKVLFSVQSFSGIKVKVFWLSSFFSYHSLHFYAFSSQCSSVQRKEDNLFLFLSFFFLLLWLPSSFSVTISPGREENRARRGLTWKASRLGLKSLPWSQRFSIPKLFGISRSSSNCSQILLSGLSAEAEWEWNEGSEGHGRQSKQCYEKVTIPARMFFFKFDSYLYFFRYLEMKSVQDLEKH